MNLDVCSGWSLGMVSALQVPPGKVEAPGDGSRQNAKMPDAPVYCSKRIYKGSSSTYEV